MTNQQEKQKRPNKTDKVLMMYYREFNMTLKIRGENDYDLFEPDSATNQEKYLGVMERKVILENQHFKQWLSRKKGSKQK
jgi:hypothetical protein